MPERRAQSGKPASSSALAGCTVVITRPAGTGTAWAKQVRALGGLPLLLPGLSLRAAADPALARMQWDQAQQGDMLVFTSPAAVRYAFALAPPQALRATVVAVGQGTARALHRHGITAHVPTRQDSEGVLALPVLQQLHGRRVALITAPGGRGLLSPQLAARGADVREVHVYQRGAPRLDRRHADAVQALPPHAYVLLSSAEALHHLREQLPSAAWVRLCRATAIASSERIEAAARAAGFQTVVRARSAARADLLATICDVCSQRCHEAGDPGC